MLENFPVYLGIRCSFRSQLEKSSKANNEGTTPTKLQTKRSDSTCNISWNNAATTQSYFPDESSTVEFLNYSVNCGGFQISKPHFLQTVTLETQQLMVIRSHHFYELWLNGFEHGKQKELSTMKSLRWQHKLVQHLSELFFLLHR